MKGINIVKDPHLDGIKSRFQLVDRVWPLEGNSQVRLMNMVLDTLILDLLSRIYLW